MNHSAEIAALKLKVADLESKLNPPTPEPDPVPRISPIDRLFLGDGEANVQPGAESYEERMQARRAAEDRHSAAEKAELARNNGCYQDACGIWRRASDGQRVAVVAREQQAVDEIVRDQFKETKRDE